MSPREVDFTVEGGSIERTMLAFSPALLHHAGRMDAAIANSNEAKDSDSAPVDARISLNRSAFHRTTVTFFERAWDNVARLQSATGLSLSEAVSALIEQTTPNSGGCSVGGGRFPENHRNSFRGSPADR